MGGSGKATTIGKRRLPPIPNRERALRVVFSPDPAAIGRVLPLDGTSWVIGRSAPGEGLVEDQRMSREHLRVAVDPATGAYSVDDLESRNGTFIGGKPLVEPVFVAPNLVIAAGDTLLVVDEAPPVDRFPHIPGGGPAAEAEIVGASFAAQAWRKSVGAIGPARGSVLLLGPTGSGKEVTARALHVASRRAGRFVAVNCAAIPPEIAEAELFGYRKGAFTGAADDRAGFFMEASGGTLFLDEIGDLPAPIQAKLLRVLEESVVQPLGGGAPKAVDLRVIAATQLDLTATGFRRDLYARLADWVLVLPGLADRRADILLMFDHFLRGEGVGERRYTAELAEALLLHNWSLNARELRHLARRLAALAQREREWDVVLLPEELQRPVRERAQRANAAPTKEAIEAALQKAAGNVSLAAEGMGHNRKWLYRWMHRLGIDPSGYR